MVLMQSGTGSIQVNHEKAVGPGQILFNNEFAHWCGTQGPSMAEMMIWDGTKDFHSYPRNVAWAISWRVYVRAVFFLE